MPSAERLGRSVRSRLGPSKADFDLGPQGHTIPQFERRQAGTSLPSFPAGEGRPTPPTGRPLPQSLPFPLPSGLPSPLPLPQGIPQPNLAPGSSSGEDNSDNDNDDDDNPFVPTTTTTTQPLPSVTATTIMSTSSLGTTTPAAFYTSTSTALPNSISGNSMLSTSTSSELASTKTPQSTQPSTTLASPSLAMTTNTASALPLSTNLGVSSAVPNASKHPISQAAIAVPVVLGTVAAVAACYYLLRYCTPIRARWALFRARRGQRIPEEEDGAAPSTAPHMAEAYAAPMQPNDSMPPTPVTPAPSYFRGRAVALPMVSTRALPPVLVRKFSKSLPQNPRTNHTPFSQNDVGYVTIPPAVHARSQKGNDPDNSSFPLPKITTSRGPARHSRHPSGLENNPPTPAPHRTATSSTLKSIPSQPNTPAASEFPPQTPPSSIVNHRLRKSITPSESASNVSESPRSYSSHLMPPLPIAYSRWSNDTSSCNHGLAEALNFGPDQDRDIGKSAVGTASRPLSRFPSLQSSSGPIRAGSVPRA